MADPNLADLERTAASLAEEPDELQPFDDTPNGSTGDDDPPAAAAGGGGGEPA